MTATDRDAFAAVNAARSDGGYARATVRTNANGSTLTRDVAATYDPATKTFSKDVSVDRERAEPATTP
jgi:hypothetical protein